MATLEHLNTDQILTLIFVWSAMATGGLWMGGRVYFRVGL